MVRIRKVLEAVSHAQFWLCAILIVFMAFAVTYEAISRYLLGSPTIWVTEVSSYMLVAVAFLGAAWTLKVDGHIRMELLADIGGMTGRKISDFIMFAVIFAVSASLLWTGWNMTAANYEFGWRASTLLATPLWIPQCLIPLGAFNLCVQSLLGLVDTISGRRYADEVMK